MKRTKKHILGACGLALVAAVTAIAVAMPTPRASATGSASSDTTVQVMVTERTESVRIISPADGTEIDQSSITISYNYVLANKITHKLVNKTTGEVFVLTDLDYLPTEHNGTHSVTLNLDNYGGYGKYVFYVTINDDAATEDAVSFEYIKGSIPVPDTPGEDESGSDSAGTPDTGGLDVPETNLIISRLDIVVSGLVVFMLVALIAIHIMRKNKDKDARN